MNASSIELQLSQKRIAKNCKATNPGKLIMHSVAQNLKIITIKSFKKTFNEFLEFLNKKKSITEQIRTLVMTTTNKRLTLIIMKE